MKLISSFDPWHSSLCTCPPKMTFNPYTGCDHRCIYCYASSYIPRFFECRPKKNLISRLEREAKTLKGETISIANSSDPYPNLDTNARLTRSCLEILSKQDCRIQVITKSNLITRDIDLLKKIPSMVSLTITTDDDATAKLIEPCAPSPSKRLAALRNLAEKNVATSARIDPIIPFLNDEPESLVKQLSTAGVRHLTCSTLKVNPQIWRRLTDAIPEVARKLGSVYFEHGERKGRYTYLPRDLRFRLLQKTGDLAKEYGMSFGACREGSGRMNTAECDGSWLLGK